MTATLDRASCAVDEPAAVRIDVVEAGAPPSRPNWLRCKIGEHIRFCTTGMEADFFANWKPVLHDALPVAAAVEFCDRSKKRSTRQWDRRFDLRIPIHEPEHWNGKEVHEALVGALSFLTGDRWEIGFYGRRQPQSAPIQSDLALGKDVSAVIPFGDGLDSRTVAGPAALELGDGLMGRGCSMTTPLEGLAVRGTRHRARAGDARRRRGRDDRLRHRARRGRHHRRQKGEPHLWRTVSGAAAGLLGGSVLAPERSRRAWVQASRQNCLERSPEGPNAGSVASRGVGGQADGMEEASRCPSLSRAARYQKAKVVG